MSRMSRKMDGPLTEWAAGPTGAYAYVVSGGTHQDTAPAAPTYPPTNRGGRVYER
jgi:hypothetical protein